MPDIIFTVSTTFLTKAREAVVHERPELTGQSNTVLNEAARQRIRELARNWVNRNQLESVTQTAQSAVIPVGDVDIT